jgi:hypothetical protein
MKSKIVVNNTIQKIKVSNVGGRLTSTAPITLKNQTQVIDSIESLSDVSALNKVDGATLVYNTSNQKYEITPLDYDDLTGDIDAIDGGEFN